MLAHFLNLSTLSIPSITSGSALSDVFSNVLLSCKSLVRVRLDLCNVAQCSSQETCCRSAFISWGEGIIPLQCSLGASMLARHICGVVNYGRPVEEKRSWVDVLDLLGMTASCSNFPFAIRELDRGVRQSLANYTCVRHLFKFMNLLYSHLSHFTTALRISPT